MGYLFSKEMVAQAIDFILGEKSPIGLVKKEDRKKMCSISSMSVVAGSYVNRVNKPANFDAAVEMVGALVGRSDFIEGRETDQKVNTFPAHLTAQTFKLSPNSRKCYNSIAFHQQLLGGSGNRYNRDANFGSFAKHIDMIVNMSFGNLEYSMFATKKLLMKLTDDNLSTAGQTDSSE
jgi:hypothetical protein